MASFHHSIILSEPEANIPVWRYALALCFVRHANFELPFDEIVLDF